MQQFKQLSEKRFTLEVPQHPSTTTRRILDGGVRKIGSAVCDLIPRKFPTPTHPSSSPAPQSKKQQQKQQMAHGVFDGGEELGVGDGVGHVGADDVEAQPLGRLVRHLDAVLQDRHRELVGRVARQPEAEVRVARVRVQLLQYRTVRRLTMVSCTGI